MPAPRIGVVGETPTTTRVPRVLPGADLPRTQRP